MKHLARLLRSGAITPQTYAEGLSALAETPPIPAPHQRREPPTPAPCQRREWPTRLHASEGPSWARESCRRLRWAPTSRRYLSEMQGERPIPAPRWRRPIPAPRQLVFHRTRWVIGSFLRGWQMDVPQGHPHGVDPKAFLEGGATTDSGHLA